MPCIQIMDNGPSLDYFTALANNAYEKIKHLVHHTRNNEFSFNFLHDPKKCHSITSTTCIVYIHNSSC